MGERRQQRNDIVRDRKREEGDTQMGFLRRQKPERQPTGDPDLDQFYRSIDAADSGPQIGTANVESFSAEDYRDLGLRMSEQFQQDDFDAVWQTRCGLGYQMNADICPTDSYFWINAFGALSGLALGLRDHPVVAMSAGLASNALDRSQSQQTAAVDAIERQFFG